MRPAVAIDPGFAEAYMSLAGVAGARGDRNMHAEYFRLALEHGDRLSERNRLVVDMQIAMNKRDHPRAARMLEGMFEALDPDRFGTMVKGALADRLRLQPPSRVEIPTHHGGDLDAPHLQLRHDPLRH